MKVVERLDGSHVVDNNGDVRSIDDMSDPDITESSSRGLPMVDSQRIAHMRQPDPYEHDINEYYRLQDTRNAGDFTERNEALVEMAGKIGEAKRHEGAAIQLTAGNYIPRYSGSPEVAEGREVAAYNRALELGGTACSHCDLKEFCALNPEELAERLKPAKDRDRFKARVKKSDNNHLCETNLKPGSQNPLVA